MDTNQAIKKSVGRPVEEKTSFIRVPMSILKSVQTISRISKKNPSIIIYIVKDLNIIIEKYIKTIEKKKTQQ